MATTANDMILQGMQHAGVLGLRDDLDAANAAYGLKVLNSMLDSWRLEKLMVFHLKQEELTLVVNQRSYSIGDGAADFDTPRPIEIVDPVFIREGQYDYPVKLIQKNEYGKLVTKTNVTSNLPRFLFYDQSYPNGTIFIYPAPSAANTLVINSPQIIQNFATKTTAVSLPPGYQDAIEYELAIRFAAKKGFAVNNEIKRIANETKARIKTHNSKAIISNVTMSGDYTRQYDIQSDQ